MGPEGCQTTSVSWAEQLKKQEVNTAQRLKEQEEVA